MSTDTGQEQLEKPQKAEIISQNPKKQSTVPSRSSSIPRSRFQQEQDRRDVERAFDRMAVTAGPIIDEWERKHGIVRSQPGSAVKDARVDQLSKDLDSRLREGMVELEKGEQDGHPQEPEPGFRPKDVSPSVTPKPEPV